MDKRLKILIDTLNQKKLVIITYLGQDYTMRRKLFVKGKQKCYNPKNNSLNVVSYLEEIEETIQIDSINQFLISTNKFIHDPVLVKKAKEKYIQLTETYKGAVNNITILELAHLIQHQHLMTEEDKNLIKNYVLGILQKAIQKEKDTITAEFKTYNNIKTEDIEVDSELTYVLDFLNGIAVDMSIFEGRDTIEEILNAWPTLLQPSPLVDLYPCLRDLAQP